MEKNKVPLSSLPRERLLEYGVQALSNQELLAILLRTGSKKYSVMELSARVLTLFPSLYELKNASLTELQQISGVGQIKAIELKAMMELGCRIQRANQPKLGKVVTSFDLAHQLMSEMKDFSQEHLICLYLNTKNEVIFRKTLFVGSVNQSVAHPREIFREAVRCSAARIICSHNHPSGDPSPSENDRQFTQRLKQCGEMMGIEILDHLIIGSEEYISLREEGFWN